MARTAIAEEHRPQPETEAEAPTCQHHWLIETPHGALSRGRCKRCGEEREFRNSATDHLWEDESNSGYNAWRGRRPGRVAQDDEIAASSGPREPAVMV